MSGQRTRRPSGYCEKCGTWRQSLHREHIIPRFKGGNDDESNVQWLCANCHEDKTRDDLKGMPGANKGRKFSEISRQRMREAAHKRTDDMPSFQGRKHTEATKQLMSQTRLGMPHPMPHASEQRKQRTSASLKRYYAENPRLKKNDKTVGYS